MSLPGPRDQPIYRLKVTLRHIRPAIWRRIEAPADLSLFDLHRTLQGAMGWTDSHLHQVRHRGVYYGPPDREFGMPVVSERRTRLGDLLSRPRDRLVYEYDFGDGWEHDVVLEAIAQAQPGVRYPRVIAGKRACPPEDVGGPFGYEEFAAAITDPAHKEHAGMLEWVGGQFDPGHFDVVEANDRVPRKRDSAATPDAPDKADRRRGAESTKREKQQLRRLAQMAYERELGAALREVQARFAEWERGQIPAFDLTDAIHEFHDGIARELWKKYDARMDAFNVARAFEEGLLTEAEFPAALLAKLDRS